ncbi:RNA polymerase II-associated protein 1-like [Glandiceps talaboti]
MIRRPKAGETEDDLLRYQEEFLAQKAESAVKLVKKGDKRKASGDESHVSPVKRDVVTLGGLLPSGIPSDDVPVKRSKFKSQRTSQKTSGVGRERVRIDVEDSEDMEETMDRHDGHITSVLSDIIERDIQNTPVYLPRSMTQGFPSVSHRGNIKETKTVKEKKALSLFAQHFSKSSPASFGVIGERQPMTVCTSFSKPKKTYHTASTDVDEAMEVEETGTSEMSTQAGSENPILITGSGLGGDDIPSSEGSGGIQEAKKIHQENLSKLSELSEEEILAEQEKLKSMLDPKVVQFIRSRKQHTSSKPAEEMTEAVKEETTAGTFQQEEHHKEKQENFKQVTTSEVTLPIRAEKDWVNMNVVEEDKMEWMHDVPKPKPGEKKMGIQARFDLQGQVIGRLADVPMREGLHHHGEDPEAPGYTLEELFHLCRSTAMNQRVISLQTLAKIIYNYRLDNLGGSVDTPLIPKLLEAGLVFILRWSLDDTSEAGIAASIEGFKALLVQPTDEECLDKVFSWYRGYEMHPLCPVQYDDEGETGNKNPKDQHETELLEQDVVKGLLKMNFLERLRYILEVCRPAPNVVMNIFAILTRIGRHSPESCYEIIKCPRLMNTVFSSFLPTTWKPTNRPLVDDIYGYPAHHAMKLVRVLCMAGRNMAAVILSKYNLMSAIVRYTTQDPEDMQLYPGEAFLLSIESFHTWKIYISYGLASDSVRELYPVLMQHVQLFPRISVLPRPVSEEKSLQAVYELHMVRCAAILGLLEMTVHVGAMATDLQSKQSMRTEETERSPDFPVPSIDWSHVAGLLSPIELCFQRWMTEITNTDEPLSDYGLTLTNSCLNFIASFYGKVSQQPSYSAIEVLQHIEKFVGSIIVPFMTSGNFYSYVINLR